MTAVRSAEYDAYISSAEWKATRTRILEQRGYRCETCGATKKLEVHHLTYERFGHERDDDLRVLCSPCHHRTHGRAAARQAVIDDWWVTRWLWRGGRIVKRHPRETLLFTAGLGIVRAWWETPVYGVAAGLALIAVVALCLWVAARFHHEPEAPTVDGPLLPARRGLVPVPGPVDELAALEVGQILDGPTRPWTLPLWIPDVGGVSWLFCGVTRSGKSGLWWSIAHELAPRVRYGDVRLWGIDPKRGAELGRAEPLFTELERCKEDDIDKRGTGAAKLLERAYVEMNHRFDVMEAAGVDVHTPTVAEPLIVIVIDELAQILTVRTKSISNDITTTLEWLLRQGAAAGVVVVAGTQDPRVEVVKMRSYFPAKVCFRVADSGHPDLVLGAGARAKGATADEIPAAAKGMAFVFVDGDPKPVRVQVAKVDRAAVARLAVDYARVA